MEFEAPPSPDSSCSQDFTKDEHFSREQMIVPSQLYLTAHGVENSDEVSSYLIKPQHVVLNHLFIENTYVS